MAFVNAPIFRGFVRSQGREKATVLRRGRVRSVGRRLRVVRMTGDDGGDAGFRPHSVSRDDSLEDNDVDGFLPVELVEGYLENAKVGPKIDIDADEYMLMWKLRKMLHEDDFKRIFKNNLRIGEM